MNPTRLDARVPGAANVATADTQNHTSPARVNPFDGPADAISIPVSLVLNSDLQPDAIGLLIHLLACPQCFTTADLIDHGVVGRARGKSAEQELIRRGYYRICDVTTEHGDTVKYVQVAQRPGDFSPGVCISRVYFAARADLIKIGTTTHLRNRMKQLGYDGGPVTLIADFPGGPVMEDALHDHFARYRVQGEWFRDCTPIRRMIARLREVAA